MLALRAAEGTGEFRNIETSSTDPMAATKSLAPSSSRSAATASRRYRSNQGLFAGPKDPVPVPIR